ncbi:MAG: hypothetical protein H5T84_01635 [Thermoleophilia bacterium]|nr:hypothetical protein [Thermoleophilia bacterium]
MGYLNEDFVARLGCRPLRYVDVDDPELKEYPALAEAVAARRRLPLVLAGDEVLSPGAISYYWIEDQLERLGIIDGKNGGGRT